MWMETQQCVLCVFFELTCHCHKYVNSESCLVNVTRRPLPVVDQHVAVINKQRLGVSVDKQQ